MKDQSLKEKLDDILIMKLVNDKAQREEITASILALFPKPMDASFGKKRAGEIAYELQLYFEGKHTSHPLDGYLEDIQKLAEDYSDGTLDRPMVTMGEDYIRVIVAQTFSEPNFTMEKLVMALVNHIPTPEKEREVTNCPRPAPENICPECDGQGETLYRYKNSYRQGKCHTCQGTGHIPPKEVER